MSNRSHIRAWTASVPQLLWPGRLRILTNGDLHENYPVAVFRPGHRTVVMIAPFLRPGRRALRHLPPGFTAKDAVLALLDVTDITTETAGYYTVDEGTLLPVPVPEGYTLRFAKLGDEAVLEDLAHSMTEQEWMLGEVTARDRAAILVLDAGGKVMAAAGCVMESPRLADLSVAVRPEARNRGLGSAAVSSLCLYLFTKGYVVQYRAEDRNTASVALCTRLGFTRSFTMEGALVRYPDEENTDQMGSEPRED